MTFAQPQQEPPGGQARELPARADRTTPENPWPLRLLSENLHAYIARCAPTWVEGQIIELNRRARVTYVTLRDVEDEISVPVTLFAAETAHLDRPLEKGMRVVTQLKPDFWTKTGRLSMLGRGIRPVGLGDLLERLERLRRALGEEGLFDPARKKPLPLLPRRIGLVTGRNSDAEKDVVRNATLRWPAVRFEIREVAVQGAGAVRAVTRALQELDAHPEVDVVVIARGGGSFEDLLAFSDESLVRAVAAARTPVVSAIGHENDQPLLDWVADLRASTPTDAGKRIVPDVVEERAGVARARASLDRAVRSFLDREASGLVAVRSRPALAQPESMLLLREEDVDRLRTRALAAVDARTLRERDAVRHLRARVRALSPQETLQRGYAVVVDGTGAVVADAAAVRPGDALGVRLAAGELGVRAETVSARCPGERPGPAPEEAAAGAGRSTGPAAPAGSAARPGAAPEDAPGPA
ncbi:exodeoxyribonuclease VII large subunit [Kocuria flava]|uniref:exodeoxyribonuclease VII large subunit n=1 Tax=Kocuria flava TaxID=446860 RepID=UPI001FF4722B|nr:exodeoxyribonuclease VII large subunit [Kocuria flava]MCJ8503912.1 exodeoxyribonuclease VII large subunit [Kocuria flava]